MIVDYHRLFKKDWKHLQPKVKQAFRARFQIFRTNPFNPILSNHKLQGYYGGCRSINVTGDYRAIFVEEMDSIKFLRIGTHAELYGR